MMLFSGLINVLFFTSMMSFMGMAMSPQESSMAGDAGTASESTDSASDTAGQDNAGAVDSGSDSSGGGGFEGGGFDSFGGSGMDFGGDFNF
jgi:hypothetical protein